MNFKKKYMFLIIIILAVVIVATLIYVISGDNTLGVYNNPVVPKGFNKVETKEASWELENGIPKGWNKGLVIKDSNDNEFVWVPVDNVNVKYQSGKLELQNFKDTDIVNNLPKDIKDEGKQIKKYGGFYIARYEAGQPSNMQDINSEQNFERNNKAGLPISKKDAMPWNYISYDNAKLSAELMYNNDVQSGMITRTQYNTVIEWLTKENYDTKNDSRSFGNFSTSEFEFSGKYLVWGENKYSKGENIKKYNDSTKPMILATGTSERNMTNNIYDIAGNLGELLNEKVVNDNNTGYINYSSNSDKELEKLNLLLPSNDIGTLLIGFRVVLYMK